MTITKRRALTRPPTIGISMRNYEAPMLNEVGSVADITRGDGLKGDADSWWIFSWGTEPDPTS